MLAAPGSAMLAGPGSAMIAAPDSAISVEPGSAHIAGPDSGVVAAAVKLTLLSLFMVGVIYRYTYRHIRVYLQIHCICK